MLRLRREQVDLMIFKVKSIMFQLVCVAGVHILPLRLLLHLTDTYALVAYIAHGHIDLKGEGQHMQDNIMRFCSEGLHRLAYKLPHILVFFCERAYS